MPPYWVLFRLQFCALPTILQQISLCEFICAYQAALTNTWKVIRSIQEHKLYLFTLATPHGMWDLSSPASMEPSPSAVEARSLNPWVLRAFIIGMIVFIFFQPCLLLSGTWTPNHQCSLASRKVFHHLLSTPPSHRLWPGLREAKGMTANPSGQCCPRQARGSQETFYSTC